MKQIELIERIKKAFTLVHKRVGIFQQGQLEELFKEEEETKEFEMPQQEEEIKKQEEEKEDGGKDDNQETGSNGNINDDD